MKTSITTLIAFFLLATSLAFAQTRTTTSSHSFVTIDPADTTKSVVSPASATEIDGQRVLFVCEYMPQYPNGESEMMHFLQKNYHVPKVDEKPSRIYAQFIIDTTGSVRNVGVLKPNGITELSPFDREAIRVVRSMPKWIPGTQDGKKVPILFNLPINVNK